MTRTWIPHLSTRQTLGLGGGALLLLGAAVGAGAMALTRPTIEMAPTLPTPIAHLADARGIVTVRGRVAEIYGDRFVVQDASGRALVDAGSRGVDSVHPADPILVQGRFDDGQLRVRYLVDASGTVQEVGPPPPPPGAFGPPPPPPPGPAVPPSPLPGGPGAPPPPAGPGAVPPVGVAPGAAAPLPPAAPSAAGTPPAPVRG